MDISSARARSGPQAAATGTPTILAFGDSLIAGYGLPARHSFAAQLEHLLQDSHPGAKVINAGMSGDTTGLALKRLPTVLSRLKVKPDLAIVELGANDLIRGVRVEAIRANLDTIIVELGRMGIPVLLARMEAPAFLGAFGAACTAIYTELAARHGIASASFLPRGVLSNPAMCLYDRVHPNALGVEAISRHFLPAVVAALAAREEAAA